MVQIPDEPPICYVRDNLEMCAIAKRVWQKAQQTKFIILTTKYILPNTQNDIQVIQTQTFLIQVINMPQNIE